MLRKTLGPLVALVMLAAVVLPTTSALAAPPDPGSFLNASGVPVGSVLCLNITYKVTNDEDSGLNGYWALDNYNKSIQVWQVPDGSFYAIAKYEGKWSTFAGALSPGAGTPFSRDGSGTMHGGWVGTFAAPAGCPDPMLRGNVDTYDFGGTKADLLLGPGSVGAPTPFNALAYYFPGFSDFNFVRWGWTYKYRNQTWSNFDTATTGDIVF